jgi:hypothetical protein
MPESRRISRGRRGLLARVLERRRLEATPSPAEDPTTTEVEADGRQVDRIAALESRLDNLESLIEGLQETVHRDAVRREREIQELEQKIARARMSRSLAEDGRRHAP